MNIDSLTDGTIEGQGVFDQLMYSAKSHLDIQYKDNRFSGDEYAKAYTGIATTVMQQAIQYVLTAPQSNAQVALLEAQASKVLVDQELVAAQKANVVLEGNNITKQGLVLDKNIELADLQKIKLTEDTLLVTQQRTSLIAETANIALIGNKLSAEITSIDAGVINTQANTAILTQQLVNLVTDNANAVKQGSLLLEQITKSQTEITHIAAQTAYTGRQSNLVDQQTLNMVAEKLNIPKQGLVLDKQVLKLAEDITASAANRLQTEAQVLLINEQVGKLVEDILLVKANTTKTTQEVSVLTQRTKTEEAQIRDMVDGITVTGVVGKQKSLYAAQTDGFQRDAEQKVLKTYADIWSVQRTTDAGFSTAGTGLGASELNSVAAKALAGINVII
jgi:hypothetical protein